MTVLSEADAGPASIGHNKGPTLEETLNDVYSGEIAAVDALAKRANFAAKTIESVEHRDQTAELARDANDHAKKLTKMHHVEKAPHLAAGRTVDNYFNPVVKRLDTIARAMLDRVNRYNAEIRRKADDERRAQEDAQRRAVEDARKAAAAAAEAGRTDDAIEELKEAATADAEAAKIAAAPRVDVDDQIKTTTAGGAALGTRKNWSFEIVDYEAIDLNKLRLFIKREHIELALRAHVRQQRDNVPIAGVRFFEDEKAVIRS